VSLREAIHVLKCKLSAIYPTDIVVIGYTFLPSTDSSRNIKLRPYHARLRRKIPFLLNTWVVSSTNVTSSHSLKYVIILGL